MPDIFIAYRCRKDRRALYVAQLPGEGGADYGYGIDPDGSPRGRFILDGARCLTGEQVRAFMDYVTPLLSRDETANYIAVPNRPCTCSRSVKQSCPRKET